MLGVLQAIFYIAVGLLARRPVRGGPGRDRAAARLRGARRRSASGRSARSSRCAPAPARRSRRLFPVLFVFLFISSMNTPRNLIAVDWFRALATVNPVSYLIECVRSLIITGWDARALALGFGIAIVLAIVSLARRVVGARPDGWSGHEVVARRLGGRLADAEDRDHDAVAPAAVAHVPALLLHRVRRRALAGAERARASTTRTATRRSSSSSCCCSRPPSAACSPASASPATSRAASRAGCCSPRPTGVGIVLGYALAAVLRWAITATLLTAIALAAGMQVGGGAVDVIGLYTLALLVNVCGFLWSAGHRDAAADDAGRAADADAGLPAALPRPGLRAARPARRRACTPSPASTRSRTCSRPDGACSRAIRPRSPRVRPRARPGARLQRSGLSAGCARPRPRDRPPARR